MQAPLSSTTITTPGALTSSTATQRTVELIDPTAPLSLVLATDTVTVNGRTYTRTYNAGRRRTVTTSPAGRQMVVTTDAQGRPVTTQVGDPAPTTTTYDAHGRVATVTQGTGAEARTTTFGYDTLGRLATITDAAGRQVSFGSDAAGRMTSQVLPDGRVIAFAYDANGNLTAVTPPSRPDHAFDYTLVDLPSAYRPPLLQQSPSVTTYEYNLDRQLTRVTRPDGLLIDFGYDPAGRLGSQMLPGTASITSTYDPVTGNLRTITAADGGTLTFAYDGTLLLSETWAGTVNGSVSRTYDSDLRVASQSVNGASAVTFSYDGDSLLAGAGALTMARNADNGLLDTTALGAISDDRDYSLFGELSAYAATGAQQNLLQVTYERDKLGRITRKTESIAGGAAAETSYKYDLAGRLWQVCVDAACTTVQSEYLYDANGNRIAGSFDTPSGTVVSATYDDQDRLASYETTLGGAASFAYGANGDLESKTAGSDVTRYSYDVLGNLKEVVLHEGEPNEQSITYVVDGRNRRIGKQVNGTLIQGFLYDDQLRIVAELDGAGTLVSRFVVTV